MAVLYLTLHVDKNYIIIIIIIITTTTTNFVTDYKLSNVSSRKPIVCMLLVADPQTKNTVTMRMCLQSISVVRFSYHYSLPSNRKLNTYFTKIR